MNRMAQNALVVDNDFFFVEFLAELLEQRDYHVTKAYDGKEGMQKLSEAPIDLMFADLVMPKVDGWQLIKYVRSKFEAYPFPVIAVSGTIVEQLDGLSRIGADYYICKGPVDKMKGQLNRLLDQIEGRPFPTAEDEIIFDADNIYPRREAAELIESLHFQRAIVECMGLGVLIVDKDARVLRVNAAALPLLNTAEADALNQKVTTLLNHGQCKAVMAAMRRIALNPEEKKTAVYVLLNDRRVRFVVSLLRFEEKTAGWIITMDDLRTWEMSAKRNDAPLLDIDNASGLPA